MKAEFYDLLLQNNRQQLKVFEWLLANNHPGTKEVLKSSIDLLEEEHDLILTFVKSEL